MGVIINIDEALKNRSQYNILREPLNELIRERQEAFEKENPLQYFYFTRSMDRFQESFTSNIGFDKAFVETNDFAIGPIFNTAEGFSATYRTRTFQGSFIITQQVLEDEEVAKAADLARQFTKRWNADIVEYGMLAMASGFGEDMTYGGVDGEGKSILRLTSADTPDGDILNEKHNPLFTSKHTIVKRKGMTDADIEAAYQSNCFWADIDYTGSSPDRISALSDVINQVITIIENYRDDNGKYAGVDGAKQIVTCNDAHLKAAINTALQTDVFCMGDLQQPNPAYQRCTAVYTPYLNDIPMCFDKETGKGVGFFIVDSAYNAENHGPEMTERIPFTLDVQEIKRPNGIVYDGRQRWDINCASWRGMTYVSLVEPTGDIGKWNDPKHFTEIEPISTIVKPMGIVGTVSVKAES